MSNLFNECLLHHLHLLYNGFIRQLTYHSIYFSSSLITHLNVYYSFVPFPSNYFLFSSLYFFSILSLTHLFASTFFFFFTMFFLLYSCFYWRLSRSCNIHQKSAPSSHFIHEMFIKQSLCIHLAWCIFNIVHLLSYNPVSLWMYWEKDFKVRDTSAIKVKPLSRLQGPWRKMPQLLESRPCLYMQISWILEGLEKLYTTT